MLPFFACKACVINIAVRILRLLLHMCLTFFQVFGTDESGSVPLFMPEWISETEKAQVKERLSGFVDILKTTGVVSLEKIKAKLHKPLKCFWVTHGYTSWKVDSELPYPSEGRSLTFYPSYTK